MRGVLGSVSRCARLQAPALGVVLLHVLCHSDTDVFQALQCSGVGLQSGGRQLDKDELTAPVFFPGAQGRTGVHEEIPNDILPEFHEFCVAVLLRVLARPL